MQHFINSNKELYFGDKFFKDECLPLDFDYRAHKKEISPYFSKYGYKVTGMYNDFYSRFNGIVSDQYVSMDLYYFYIIPCLDRLEFAKAYADKNNYWDLFRGDRQPVPIVRNRNGVFYDVESRLITQEEAVNICTRLAEPVVIKPTIETGEGRGVELISFMDRASVEKAFREYDQDFIVQRRLEQHADLAELNPHSLNSMRVLTYRSLDGSIHHIKDRTFLRIGGGVSIRDNMGSGGGACHVYDDGRVDDRVVHYKSVTIGSLSKDYGVSDFRVPNFSSVLSYAKYLHEKLPYFDWIGCDISIGKDGEPDLVEFNVPPETGATQMVCGPMFGDYLDEICDRISCVKKSVETYSINRFRPGYSRQLQIG